MATGLLLKAALAFLRRHWPALLLAVCVGVSARFIWLSGYENAKTHYELQIAEHAADDAKAQQLALEQHAADLSAARDQERTAAATELATQARTAKEKADALSTSHS